MITDYKFKTEPYLHQLKAFDLCKTQQVFALLMEQGTGKSKVALDKACYQYCEGAIDAVLIVAPNGVHTNWLKNELPAHIPEYVKYAALLWNKNRKFPDNFDQLLATKDKLLFFAMNIEALATETGRKYAERFLKLKNVLMILDESSRIKTPKAQRTKAAVSLGKLAKERMILTGTPITQSPFDLFSQFKFLDQQILGNQTYTSFRHDYGIFENKINFKTGFLYDELLQYKNLDKLQKLIEPYSFRVTKDECLDLPPKIYQRYSVDLAPKQRKHYDELRDNLLTIINEKEIVTPLILTKLLRLQQIIGGFIALNEKETVMVDLRNPKLDLIFSLLEDIQGKVIIWARFVPEIKIIANSLRESYGYLSVVEYWGDVGAQDRIKAVDDFQNKPECRFFVGNARAGGMGLTLTAANTMIYFSNDFSLETRLQSEARIDRIGQQKHMLYIDIEATDTIDTKIIDALREKKNIADLITGDKLKNWL